jgi:YVTN family beta-propeller protein
VTGDSASVCVISTATNTVVATVTVGPLPMGIDITPNGAFAYVSNARDNTVSVINTATNSVVATVLVGLTLHGVAVDPNGTFAYVMNSNSDDVSKIITTTNTVVATIPAGLQPVAMAFSVRTQGPTDKDQCKNGGWATFTNPSFSNEGQCVSFVNHMNHSQ